METVAFVLYPLIELLKAILEAINQVISNYGLAIILLSLLVRLVTFPFSRMAKRAEQKHSQRQLVMEPALVEIRANSTGRVRFERTEALYQKHHYHPIHAVFSLLPLFLQLPFLLAALVLLTSYSSLEGRSFLFLSDLGSPDQLIPLSFVGAGVNLNILPLLLTGVAIVESIIKRNATKSGRLKFMIVATVIVILIYPLPAAVCLYWLTSNVVSLLSELNGIAQVANQKKLDVTNAIL